MADDPQRRQRSLLDDPDIRRGIRIGGRFLAVWAIVVSVLALAVIIVVIVVLVIILGSNNDPGHGRLQVPHGLSLPLNGLARQ